MLSFFYLTLVGMTHITRLLILGVTVFMHLLVFDAHSELGRRADGALVTAALVVSEIFFGRPLEAFYRDKYLQDKAEAWEKLAASEERASKAVDEAKTTATRVQQEIAEYVFHELRNDMNASLGVLKLIASDAARGKASLTPGTHAELNDSILHATTRCWSSTT